MHNRDTGKCVGNTKANFNDKTDTQKKAKFKSIMKIHCLHTTYLNLVHIIALSITELINMWLSDGVVRDSFKKAIVTPLIKKTSLLLSPSWLYRLLQLKSQTT